MKARNKLWIYLLLFSMHWITKSSMEQSNKKSLIILKFTKNNRSTADKERDRKTREICKKKNKQHPLRVLRTWHYNEEQFSFYFSYESLLQKAILNTMLKNINENFILKPDALLFHRSEPISETETISYIESIIDGRSNVFDKDKLPALRAGYFIFGALLKRIKDKNTTPIAFAFDKQEAMHQVKSDSETKKHRKKTNYCGKSE